jgi:uncharacterized membrane protein
MTISRRSSNFTVGIRSIVAVLLSSGLLLGGEAGICISAADEGGAFPRAAYYELSIAPENATKYIDPSTSVKSASYRFQVRNTGDSSLPYCNLALSPWDFPPDSWSYNFIPSAPFDVEVGSSVSVSLVILPAVDAEAKRYAFQLQGKGAGVNSNSITIYLDILQYANLLVKAPPVQSAYPGQTLEYVFEIVNTGNGKDEFIVTDVECSVTALTPYLKDGDNRTGDVGYKQSVNKTVVVVIPPGAKTTEGSAGLQLALWARSAFNSSRDDINWTLLQISHVYGLDLNILPPEATLVGGETAVFNISVVNLGNGKDNITLELTPRFDMQSWTVYLGTRWFFLPAGGCATTNLTMVPPEMAPPGTYGLTLSAQCSGPPYPENPVRRYASINITVPQLRRLSAPKLDFVAPEPIAAGDTVVFGFSFDNLGNSEETVDIAVVEKPRNWGAVIDVPERLSLAPGMTRWLNLTVLAPFDRNESPPGDYFVSLRVASADRSEVLDFSFLVARRPFHEWGLLATGAREAVLYPGVRAVHNFTFEVANTGDAAEEIRFTIRGDRSGWGMLQPGSISLGPGEKKTLNLTVTVPEGTEGGQRFAFDVTAASKDGAVDAKTLDFLIVVVVVELRAVTGSLSFFPSGPEAGMSVRIRVKVENSGADPARNVTVAFLGPDMKLIGMRNLSSISRGDGQVSVEFDWDGVSEGQNNISVVVDPDGIIPEPDKANNRISAVVTGYLSDLVIDGAPVIQRAGKTVTRVPLGSGVEVTVTVRNIGNYSLDLQSVKVVLSDRQTGEQDMFVINWLAAGGSVNVTFKLAKPKVGTRVITVRVNPDGAVHEKTPDNNEKSGTFYVFEGGPGPTGPPVFVVAAVAVLIFVALAAAVMRMRRKR